MPLLYAETYTYTFSCKYIDVLSLYNRVINFRSRVLRTLDRALQRLRQIFTRESEACGAVSVADQKATELKVRKKSDA